MKKLNLFVFIILFCMPGMWSYAQTFTHGDTLRGTYGTTRNWWDVLQYNIHVKFNISDSTISGFNNILVKIAGKGDLMQIDLQESMEIDSLFYASAVAPRRKIDREKIIKNNNAYFIPASLLSLPHKTNAVVELTIYFHGKPLIAKNAPWDGGIIWKKDAQNNPWVSIACQGLGASVWYPCKDHQADEPDSASLHITCPDSLVGVGNGRFTGKVLNGDNTATYSWRVSAPINNYNIIPYIGKYVHFKEIYKGEKGDLDLDYWVLEHNLEKARKQFTDVPRMMKAFEYWFGPYPFYKDGFKLVDAPHLGMEHQSAVAYGNGFQNGYKGKDLSGSGWGLKWDFIIIHESGHEWFANNITTKDIADMWVHEGFTNYSETLFTEFYYGKAAATAYVSGVRKNIKNDIPIIAPYGVNKEGSGDMYYKAGNMIHNIRQVINNDSVFRKILRGLNTTFRYSTVTTAQVEKYISKHAKMDLSKIFDQYLRTTNVPTLEYKVQGHTLSYRYTNCINQFRMPVKVNFKGERWIKPTTQWQALKLYPEGDNTFSLDPNFYLNTKKVD